MIGPFALDPGVLPEQSLALEIEGFEQADGRGISGHDARSDPVQTEIAEHDINAFDQSFRRIAVVPEALIKFVTDLTAVIDRACDVAKTDGSDDPVGIVF